MVYVNNKLAVPAPEAYVALPVLLPICKATVGEPDVVLSVCASEKWAVTVTTSPAFRALFCTPVALLI